MARSLLPWTRRSSEPTEGGLLSRLEDFPFQLSRMRAEFDRLLEEMAARWPALLEGNGWRWGLDVEDKDDAVVVRAEAPGFEPGDFDLEISGNRLILRASRKTETQGKEGEKEVRQQQCYQAVTLPEGIDAEKVEARYHNGVLTVTLPKTAAAKPKRIAVQSA